MKKVYLLLFLCLLLTSVARSQNIFSENFDDVTTLLSSGGWTQINKSYPLGTDVWNYGTDMTWGSYNGNPNSYAEANFHSVNDTAAGTISNWLITPPITMVNGYVVSFYTTSLENYQLADRLELRLNPLNTTNVGVSDTSTGDFSTLLLTVNPNLIADYTDYPVGFWGQYAATISGLSGPTLCRIAFRYYVTNAGQSGAHGSFIGVDAFSVDGPNGIVALVPETPAIRLFPNPASEQLTIDFVKPLAEDGTVHIYDIVGNVVYSFPVAKEQRKASFSVKDFAEGVYMVSMQTQSAVVNSRFIKQ